MSKQIRSKFQLFPFHLVQPSPWPIVMSFALLSLALSLAFTMHGYINNLYILSLSIIVVLSTLTLWFRDIVAEATYLGDHTIAVRKGINLGFLLFVVSEILVFAGIFWAYFHSAMSPNIELGVMWPPVGIEAIGPTDLPLLNTIILLASGATITYCHHALLQGDRKNALIGLALTFWLIVIFVSCQVVEYTNASFTISDGIFGSVFFAGTGLHFFHMIMLIVMLGICYWRLRNYQLTSNHHLGFETTVLYLHVLDVIWLFLYIVMYWWGS